MCPHFSGEDEVGLDLTIWVIIILMRNIQGMVQPVSCIIFLDDLRSFADISLRSLRTLLAVEMTLWTCVSDTDCPILSIWWCLFFVQLPVFVHRIWVERSVIISPVFAQFLCTLHLFKHNSLKATFYQISWNFVGSLDMICNCAYYLKFMIHWVLDRVIPFCSYERRETYLNGGKNKL